MMLSGLVIPTSIFTKIMSGARDKRKLHCREGVELILELGIISATTTSLVRYTTMLTDLYAFRTCICFVPFEVFYSGPLLPDDLTF